MYLKTPAEDSSGGWVGAEGLSKKEKEFMDKDNSLGIAGCGGRGKVDGDGRGYRGDMVMEKKIKIYLNKIKLKEKENACYNITSLPRS